MPVISVTRLRVRSWRFMPGFFLAAMRTSEQAKKAAGSVKVQVLRDRKNTFWTLTSWETEAALKAYMLGGAHGPAMRKLLNWCDEAAVVRWEQESPELPAWTEAHIRMQTEGRRSKVLHPSPGQEAFRIDVPDTDARRVVTFK